MSQRAAWDNFPWLGVLPPNRPDAENLNLLDSIIHQLPQRRTAAVLGSTPEYRSLISEHFDNVFILEKSTAFKASVDWLSTGDPTKEQLVLGDWLTTLPELQGQCDLLMGHYTHGNIAFGQRRQFYNAMAMALSDDGILFDTVFQPKVQLNDVAGLNQKYGNAPFNLRTLNDLNCDAIFLGDHIRERRCVDTDYAFEWLSRAARPRVVRLMEAVHAHITPRGLRWDYDPGQPPDSLGYGASLRILAGYAPTTPSAFQACVLTTVAKRRR